MSYENMPTCHMLKHNYEEPLHATYILKHNYEEPLHATYILKHNYEEPLHDTFHRYEPHFSITMRHPYMTHIISMNFLL